MSREPLIRGAWLKPGVHLDLVGAYTPRCARPTTRRSARARVYVDTRAGALKEAGDIVQPIAAGVARAKPTSPATSSTSAAATAAGRRSADEITLFKSVGTAIEDLAAAVAVCERLGHT